MPVLKNGIHFSSTSTAAFKAAVQQGGARGVMCSYNEYNGVPACGDAWLLRDVLRRGWGFDGYVTSDSGAVEWIYEPDAHNYTATPEEGVALALRAHLRHGKGARGPRPNPATRPNPVT